MPQVKAQYQQIPNKREQAVGTSGLSGMGEESTIPVTWNESKSEICLGGIECVEYRFNDNKFSFDDKQEGYCEDDDSGDELSQYDESNCENASDRTWYDPACSINIFTKQ